MDTSLSKLYRTCDRSQTRRLWTVLLCCLAAELAPFPAAESQERQISLHAIPASYSGCGALSPDTLSCDDIVPEGDASTAQFAFVLASGVSNLAGLQFGIEYDESVGSLSWSNCVQASEIPTPDWPESGSGIALAFDPPAAASADSVVLVGYFSIAASTSGRLLIVEDPRDGAASVLDSDGITSVSPLDLGIVDVSGTGMGYSPCGLEHLDTQYSPVAMFSTGTIRLFEGRPVGTVAQAAPASASVESLLVEHGVTWLEPLLPVSGTPDSVATARTGETVRLCDLAGVYRLHLAAGRDLDSLLTALAADEDVYEISPDSARTAPATSCFPPGDGIDDEVYVEAGMWNFDRSLDAAHINVEPVWCYKTQGDADLTIAIFDDGFDDDHEDLVGRVHPDSDAPSGFWNGHGYKVAGVAGAAAKNDGTGVVGTDWTASLLSLTVADKSPASIMDKIDYAVRTVGAEVGNHSYIATTNPAHWLVCALRQAYKLNHVTVACMGNGSFDVYSPTDPLWPAAAGQGVIAVGMLSAEGTFTEGYSIGAHVDLCAPGELIWTTTVATESEYGRYDEVSGTSVSAPQVAGAASLLIAYGRDKGIELYNDDVEQLLVRCAVDVDSLGFDWNTGWGELDVWGAMSRLDFPYTFIQADTIGGAIQEEDTTDPFPLKFFGVTGLTDGYVYSVVRHRVELAVEFPVTFDSPPAVWGRGVATVGFSDETNSFGSAVPRNYGQGWCGPVSTPTTDGVLLESYIYDVYDGTTFIATVPAAATNVVWAYSALGFADGYTGTQDPIAPQHRPMPRLIASARAGLLSALLSLPYDSDVTLRAYSVDGRQLAELVDGTRLRAGKTRLSWDLTKIRLSRGIIFLRMEWNGGKVVQKVVVSP